ncbi:MAG: transposase [Parachlamydiaceae bacterium]|nr:transposase [Parachlamydiaceae bacterium]
MKRQVIWVSLILTLIGTSYGLFLWLKSHRSPQLFGKCVHRVDTTEKVVALTFDDGPSSYTKEILEVLRSHEGENLDDVLDCRPKGMAIPTQMCDASNNNNPERNETDESNCLAHLRRKFFEIAEIWPIYVLPIIAFLNMLFRHEREAKEQGLNEAQTFEMHKTLSTPVLENLKNYSKGLIDDKKTEPNSNLGKAINYMFNHWEEFTLFVRKPGVPIDNNADERLMKRAVLNRKNGLFFKTEFGAHWETFFSVSLKHAN